MDGTHPVVGALSIEVLAQCDPDDLAQVRSLYETTSEGRRPRPLPSDFGLSDGDLAVARRAHASGASASYDGWTLAFFVVTATFGWTITRMLGVQITGVAFLLAIPLWGISCVIGAGLAELWHKRHSPLIEKKRAYEDALARRAHEDQHNIEAIRAAVRAEHRKAEVYWYEMDPLVFEEEVAELLRRQGLNTRTTRASGDEGVDIVASAGGTTGVVQCKRQRHPVSQPILRDLFGAMHHGRASFAIVVGLSGFTQPAWDWAEGKPMALLDVGDLVALARGRVRLAIPDGPHGPAPHIETVPAPARRPRDRAELGCLKAICDANPTVLQRPTMHPSGHESLDGYAREREAAKPEPAPKPRPQPDLAAAEPQALSADQEGAPTGSSAACSTPAREPKDPLNPLTYLKATPEEVAEVERRLEEYLRKQQKDSITVVIPESERSAVAQRLHAMRGSEGDIPEPFLSGATANPHDVESFDVNEFLRVFSRVRIENGYVLDYVYAFDSQGGQPCVYARHTSAPPLCSASEYYERYAIARPEMLLGEEPTPSDSAPYLAHLEFERSALGAFHFAALVMLVRRFHLFWHSKYNSRVYILHRTALERQLQTEDGRVEGDSAALLASLDPCPKVVWDGTTARVTFLSFEVDTGYSHLHVCVRWPNTFVKTEEDVIVRSNTTLLY